ncbi:MAG TPA: IGHMBP2 family helicase, partial [Thermotoga sp.]|nr:IGHMBP2 family helicase [Thermotoga sp.]
DEEILKLSKKRKSVRGLSKNVIYSMAKWIEYNEKVQKFYEEAKKLENKIIKRILERSDVIVGTNSSIGIDYMKDLNFDVVVIDEASQATEPSCLIPITHGKKIVMSGDHKQLPPTILNPQAEPILSKTLFERLIKFYPSNSRLLRIQYRMNEKIMGFSNKFFYDGKLIADKSVKNRTLRSLGIKDVPFDSPLKEIVSPDDPLVLVDTSKIPERFEKQRSGSTSRENALEANIASLITDCFLNMKIPSEEIGIITPYDDQVDLIKKMMHNKKIKVNTVDGFQGREKEIIILSLVRSNKKGEVGFLMDERRLNVSLTRAKSKLVIIGDFSTLSNNPLYKALLIYVKENGKYISIYSNFLSMFSNLKS